MNARRLAELDSGAEPTVSELALAALWAAAAVFAPAALLALAWWR